MRRSVLVLLAALLSLASPSIVLGGDSCDCAYREKTCGCTPARCCHHGCHRQYRERPEMSRTESRLASIPVGPILESVPAYRSTPALVLAPVVAEASYVRVREAEPRRESACETSSDRLGNLETNIRSLNERMIMIEDSIRAQNELLLKLKTKLLAE